MLQTYYLIVCGNQDISDFVRFPFSIFGLEILNGKLYISSQSLQKLKFEALTHLIRNIQVWSRNVSKDWALSRDCGKKHFLFILIVELMLFLQVVGLMLHVFVGARRSA